MVHCGRSKGSLSMATVCMTCDPEPRVNLDRMTDIVRRTRRAHPEVRLVFFGETILGWFYHHDETQAYHERISETIPGPATQAMAQLAMDQDVYICFGLTERADGVLYNAQVLIDPSGEILAVHRKVKIRNPVFQPGDRFLTIAEIDGTTVAMAICADVRHPQVIRRIREARPAIVLASLADYATGLLLPRMMGTLFDAWTVVANRYGAEPPIQWHGLITVTDRIARLRDHHAGSPHVLIVRIPLHPGDASLRRTFRRCAVGLKLAGLLLWAGLATGAATLRKALRRRSQEKTP